MATAILPPGNNVISLALVQQERQLDALMRSQVRSALDQHDVVRNACPTARQLLGDGAPRQDDGPLTKAEIQAVRAMLEDFEIIKARCPMARTLLAEI